MNYGNRFPWVLLLPSLAFASTGAGEATIPHRMMMLVLQLGVILFAARIGGILFEKMRLPGVLGELSLGIVIGPHLLGAIALPGLPQGLFPPASLGLPVSPELYGICSLAAVLLLFSVGLETDLGLFVRYSVVGSLVGLGGVVVSFLAGDLLAVACSSWLFGEPMGFLSGPCLFMGIIMTATSVGITARILSEQRKTESPEGVTILAGAVVDDVLGIILLAVGMGVITASRASGSIDWAHIGVIAGKAVGIWLVATVLGIIAARRIGAVLKSMGNPSVIAVLALGLALILAGLFEEAGLAMIIGAYVMGLSLSRTDVSHLVRERLAPTHALLVPVFFVVMGMFVDLRAFTSPTVILFGLLYTAAAIGAKLLGCGVPALLCRFNPLGALRIGTGMLPRGEVTLIIAGTGVAMGVLTGQLFGVVVFTTLLSSLIAPPVLIRLFRISRSGLKNPVAGESETPLAFAFPSARTTELVLGRLLEVFHSEGFFVHELSRSEQIFQIRKDRSVIGFRRSGRHLTFEVGKDDIPLVNTAMMEVVAELEGIARELAKPMDLSGIGRKVQDEAGSAPGRRELARHLSVSLLFPSLKADTKDGILDELMERVRTDRRVLDVEAARKAVLERESSLSTGMQHGIALPHARTDAVSALVCAVGMKHEGVAFDSIDGIPSRIFVLTLSPKSASAPQISFMSSMSQVLDAEGRQALLAAESPGEMFLALTGIDSSQVRHGILSRRSGMLRVSSADSPAPESLLLPELIEPSLKGVSAGEVIDELLNMYVKAGILSDVTEVRSAIIEREKQMPTGLEHGIAMPHGRTGQIARVQCALGVSRHGVDFGAFDGGLSHIIVLIISPFDSPSAHIRTMATLGRALGERTRERIINAGAAPEIIAAMAAGNG